MVWLYWGRVHQMALHETLRALSLDSKERAMWRIIVAVIGVIVVWIFTKGGTTNDLILRIVVTFAIFVIFPAVYVWKLLTSPAKMDMEAQDRAGAAEHQLRERLSPRIRVFLNQVNHGILLIPTYLSAPDGSVVPSPDGNPQRGPSSKWVQVCVSPATAVPLLNCEARLVGFDRLNNDGTTEPLEPEHVHCGWSMRDERAISIAPLISQPANLFTVYANHPTMIVPRLNPPHVTLQEEVQKPGRYRASIVVTADGAPSAPATFILDWRDFDNVTLTQE